MKFSHSLFFCFLLSINLSIFAQNARERGIEDYQKGDYNSAIQYLKTVTKSNKTDADAWNFLGMAYLKVSNYKESRKALENAVKQKPQNVAFHINLSYASLLSNKLGDAERQIKKAIELDSKNATAYYISGLVFLWKGKFDKVISDVDESLNIDKTLGVSYLLKSNAYLYKFGAEVAEGKKISANIHLLKSSIET